MSSTTVSLSEVRFALGVAIDSVAALLGEEVDLGSAMYWTIESPDAFDLSATPTINVGSLIDDAEHLRALASGHPDRSAASPWHDLDHVIGVLTRLSTMTRG